MRNIQRRSYVAVLFLFFGGASGWPGGAAQLPVTQVTLYKHGLAMFEREGTVAPGAEVRLEFQSSDMNDLLKSLIVTDTGGHVKAIRYDANETLEQRLSKFPFQIGEREPLADFLDRLKGSRIQITAADKTEAGVVAGARLLSAGNAAQREQITILLDSGDLVSFDLAGLTSIRLLDARQQEQLKAYLQTIADSSAHDRRSVFLESDSTLARRVRALYTLPAPIWKSSYRLSLNDREPELEGWAIVDNTTGEDWDNVRLSVVSGRPISFISPLDTARYGQRQIAELPEDVAAAPVVYGGSVDVAGSEQTGASNGALGVGIASGFGPPPPAQARKLPAPLNGRQLQSVAVAQSSVELGASESIGELFEYQLGDRITIKKNESAMLPFLQGGVEARKLLIYTEQDGEHPVNAAELSNTTGKTLDGGPVTVYDGGAYAGEALFETLKPGDKRLIGYAVDYGTRITSAYGTASQLVREIHIQDGTLRIRNSERQTRTYTVRNVDAKPKTVIVQQEANGYGVLSPKPLERTAQAYRFEIAVPANGSEQLAVETERPIWTELAITDATPDQLGVFLENKDLPETARAQIKNVSDLKKQIVDAEAALNGVNDQIKQLGDDQNRLRLNINSLNHVPGEESRVHEYSTQLAALEDRIVALRDKSGELSGRKRQLDEQLRKAIEDLAF